MAEILTDSLMEDDNLLAYYRFEGSSGDSKGIFNGTDTSITYGSLNGKFGQGAIFGAAAGKISLGTSNTLHPTAITVACWIYPTDFSAVNSILTCVGTNYHTFNLSTAAKLRSYCSLSSGTIEVPGTGAGQTAIPTNQWTHIAYTYDSSQGFIGYVNGVSDITAAAAGNLNTSSGTETWIGWEVSNVRWFYGSMDDFGIWNRALTAAEVLKLATYTPNYLKGRSRNRSIFTGISLG